MAIHHDPELHNSCGPPRVPSAMLPNYSDHFKAGYSRGVRCSNGKLSEPKAQHRQPSTQRRVDFNDKNQDDSKPLEGKGKEKSFPRGSLRSREEPASDPKWATFADSDDGARDHCRRRQCQCCPQRIADWVSGTTEGQIAAASSGFKVYTLEDIMRDDFVWPDAPVFVRESIIIPDIVWTEVDPIPNAPTTNTQRDGRYHQGQEKVHRKTTEVPKAEARKDGSARRKTGPIKTTATVTRQKSTAIQKTEPINLPMPGTNQSDTAPPRAEPAKTPAGLADEQIAAAGQRDLGNGHRRRDSNSPIRGPDCEYQTSREAGIVTLCFNLLFAMFFFSSISAFVIYDIKSLLG